MGFISNNAIPVCKNIPLLRVTEKSISNIGIDQWYNWKIESFLAVVSKKKNNTIMCKKIYYSREQNDNLIWSNLI